MAVKFNAISKFIAGSAFTAFSQLSSLPANAQVLKTLPQNNLRSKTEKVTPDHLLKQSQDAQRQHRLLVNIGPDPNQGSQNVNLRVGPFENKEACEAYKQEFVNAVRNIWSGGGTVTIEAEPTAITTEFEDITGRGGGSSLTVDQNLIPKVLRQTVSFPIPANQQNRLNLNSLVCFPVAQNRNSTNNM